MITKIQKALEHSSYGAILLTSEINRRYATRFHSTAGVCYITAKRAVFFTDFRYIEAARARISQAEVCEMRRGISYSDAVNRCLKEDRIRSIALEDRTLTHAEYQSWTKGLCTEVVPVEGLLEKLREKKEPQEVAAIIRAQRIAERAFEQVLNEIRPGVTEKEIAAKLTYLMLLYGAENMSFDPIVVSGIHSSMPHGVPSDKQVAEGDFVTMDFGCIVDGYCSDMTRTVAVGHCTEEMRRVYDIVLQAQCAGIATARAGITGAAVDAAARNIITQAGYGDAFGHGFGHGVGLYIHEMPTASPSMQSALPQGAILTAEPGIYLPEKFGVRIEDMLQITADGCKNLTEAPKELLIL